jgi:hypothetical protein
MLLVSDEYKAGFGRLSDGASRNVGAAQESFPALAPVGAILLGSNGLAAIAAEQALAEICAHLNFPQLDFWSGNFSMAKILVEKSTTQNRPTPSIGKDHIGPGEAQTLTSSISVRHQQIGSERPIRKRQHPRLSDLLKSAVNMAEPIKYIDLHAHFAMHTSFPPPFEYQNLIRVLCASSRGAAA